MFTNLTIIYDAVVFSKTASMHCTYIKDMRQARTPGETSTILPWSLITVLVRVSLVTGLLK